MAEAGNDWSGRGEVTGQDLLDLITSGKLSMFFGNDLLLIGVQTVSGDAGTYKVVDLTALSKFQ